MRTYTRQQVASQSSVCLTVANIYDYSYSEASERFESVNTLFKDEKEFEAMKQKRKQSA